MTFDTLKFTQRLQQTGVARDQPEAHAELARDMVLADLGTRNEFENGLKNLELRLTTRMGAMLAAAVGLIVAAQQLL